MRTPNLADRLSMASAAKKAQLERAKRMAEDPEQAQRLKARDEIIAARNARVAERRAATERDAAELAAKQAAEAAAREADRKTKAEARARRLAEQAKREAAEAVEGEAILSGCRAGRKNKKRRGH